MKRRKFIQSSALLGAATVSIPQLIPSRLLGEAAPSKKVTMGFIGTGLQGIGRNLRSFLRQPDAQVIAVCDCKLSAAHKAKRIVDKKYGNNDCKVYQDFRDVIARKDIDVIVISTPDHWHVPMSMMALQAGKDVFSEKPTLTIAEGKRLVAEVKKRKAAFQWGLEDRSLTKYHRLAAWVRSGVIGELETIEVSLPRKKSFKKDPEIAVPEGLDWNLWLGPAPYHAYTKLRTHPDVWRSIIDYSGGALTDWGSHLVDTAQVGARVDESGPIEVSGTAGDLDLSVHQSNAPVGFKLNYRYANGVEMHVKDGPVDIKFNGSKGWVQCKGWDGAWYTSDREIFRIKTFKESDIWPIPPDEHRDFLDSVKSRKNPAYHVDAGHRLFTALHLGHIAIRSGKTVKWDPAREAFDPSCADCMESVIYDREARDWESA